MLKKNTDSSLISLDAKKAFDLVDHIYIEETLRRYGFAQNFISMFKVLNKYILAKIMVNGFMSKSIQIGRGVKQRCTKLCHIYHMY
jgi:hypothetical protein